MARASAAERALDIIASARIGLVRSETTPQRLVFRVVGDTNPLDPHRVVIEYDGRLLVESCTCKGGEFHPVRGRCSHVKAARIVAHAIGAPNPKESQ